MKKLRLDRIISVATLVASLVAIILVLKRPAPVAKPQTPAAIAEHAQSSDQKPTQSQQSAQQPQMSSSAGISKPEAEQTASSPSQSTKPEVHINSEKISAALAQTLGSAGGANLTPDTEVGSGAPVIKDQQVSFEGDVVHGKFLTEIAGKDVWITISGHIGEKDGYATFDPTEFKVGDTNVPVELVNPALQKKLGDERDRLKLDK
jgi:hypothetical protein